MTKPFIALILLLCLLACKKEAPSIPQKMEGKWKLHYVIPIKEDAFPVFNPGDYHYLLGSYVPLNSEPYSYMPIYQQAFTFDVAYLDEDGEIELEIDLNGSFKYLSSKHGDDKLSVEAITSRIMMRDSTPNNYSDNGSNMPDVRVYEVQLKQKSGQQFQFLTYYDMETDQLYAVPWYKGAVYYKTDHPFVSGAHFGRTNLSTTNQYWGIFKRVS